MKISPVPSVRIHALTTTSPVSTGEYVLYWMTGNRRLHFNFALQLACEFANQFNKPLLVFEALRAGYEHANDRHHTFVLQGMAQHAAEAARYGVTYFPYVEMAPGDGKGLLRALAQPACAVVTDDVPGFFLPRMQEAAVREWQKHNITAPLFRVDSCGLYPMAATDRVFPSAHTFRRHLQKELPAHLLHVPDAEPLVTVAERQATVPDAVLSRYPQADLSDVKGLVARVAIDHSVVPSPLVGGERAARARLASFLSDGFVRYASERSAPEANAQSGLSPYLHFGQLSVHEVWQQLVAREGWDPSRVNKVNGSREGFWGMSGNAESFIDELVTWRELGYNMCSKRDDYDRFSSLPTWAQQTLRDHQGDARQYRYSRAELDDSKTHDPLWNAAQRQLVREGTIHNYVRMLWGKKVLEWSPDAETALSTLIALNNRYALDGRDPNSYSGIFWCFGRYDRPWGPVRPIFGTVRYMSSDNTQKKFDMKPYLRRYAA